MKTRRKINRMPTLDAETYMMQYPGYAFFWKEHNNGDVDRWLSFGAELVPESMAQARQIEGYKSHAAGSWVNRQVGFDRGGNVRTDYLMMMPEAVYYEVKIAPELERNKATQDAMRHRGEAGAVESEVRGTAGTATYAPNLPTGGVGFEMEVGPD